MKPRALLILSFFLVLVLSGSGPVIAKDIVVLSQFPLSGPLGSNPEIGWGYIDGMNWFNNEQGGLNGKKIKWHLEDFRYSPKIGVANFTRYSAMYGKDELLMASGYQTDTIVALAEKVNKEEKIPWLDGSYSCALFSPEMGGGPSKYPYYYSHGAHYCDQLRLLVKWIKDNHKGPGKARVGLVYSPSAYGRDGPQAGIAYAKKLGMDVVAEIEYPYSATDATVPLMELRKSKAQYVIIHGYIGAMNCTVIFFKTAAKIIPKAQILGTTYMGGRTTIKLIGPSYNGFIWSACYPNYDAIPRSDTVMENDWVKLVHDFAKKYRPEAYKKDTKGGISDIIWYEIGLRDAIIIQETLKRADKAGDLTREGIKKVLDNMVWDFMGMFDGKTFSYKSHTIPMLRLYKAKAKAAKMKGKKITIGTHVPISDWINMDKIKW